MVSLPLPMRRLTDVLMGRYAALRVAQLDGRSAGATQATTLSRLSSGTAGAGRSISLGSRGWR